VITLRKWFPFVHPTPYDVRALAAEKRAERLDGEYREAIKAVKMRTELRDLEVELYDKRARQNTIELEIFQNHKRFDKYV
jgi:hypothetical protein